ncbi:hypothetical protein EXM30_04885 [Clostridium botulinum]|uniref:DNA primase family protein n=1 Tax=Clostridium botulinum TaxID=1491 RepID=UPI0007E181A9|nr:phage/plasmid primase, P4 family [Clostridium botulinum]KEI82844.1 hypothetical protein N487_01480 [Clostridium botulinum B2 331]MCJ8173510.1 phage/plasmid primase, P4 family [Clostridium botulinum]NFA89736.1 hypothetical protein [Clostridium botulinum]NFB20049.1 hypothetical protein [Clostridium botulinum]NFI38451.1 hypothetical protein [Clostridium botulinum]
MFSDEELEDIEQMGIVICKKTFTVKYFSPNRYASYVASRLQLIFNEEDFYVYNTGVWNKLNEKYLLSKLREKIHKYFDDIWTLKREKEYIEALKRLVFYNSEFNSDKRYINLINGMYDLEKFILIEHRPELYSTIRIPIEYDENAECPNFMKFIDQCFLSDEESKLLAQEWAGYLLTAETKAQKALILYGEGANGKGVFIDTISYLIGQENISSIPLNELHKGFSRVCLHNKLANISNENECNGNSFNTQYFKAITGEDVINAEQKNKPVFEFKPTVKLVFSTNNLPHTKDTSYGFMRRLSILHFKNTVKEKNRDRYLKEKLKLESQGIFLWAVKGLKRLKENNFRFSECATSNGVIKQYEKELNPMVLFFEECITNVNGEHREDKRIIYNSFKVWAEANGMEGYAKISTQKFWKKFQEQAKVLGYSCTLGRSNTFRYCTNIKVIGEYRVNPDNPVLTGTYVVKPPLGG